MEHLLTFITTVTLILTASIVATDNPGAAEGTKAQAISGDSGGGSGVGSDNLLLVRRYVPRFIGKRDQVDTDIDSVENKDKSSDYDLNPVVDYVENLIEHYDDLELGNLEADSIKEDPLSELDSENFEDTENEEFQDEDSGEEDSLLDTQEEKRYVPSFVGKRYTALEDGLDDTLLVDKRYRPMFVGKRYRPMFVGKRYRPMFVGKRYQPKFIGKRYTPRFIGKRYTPRFIGKRYAPKFIGKRYTPKFVGKRYTPKFIGKRYTPKFVGKRFQPVFVGKKSEQASSLLEKRYKPYFVGKKDQEQMPNGSNHVEKRSISNLNEETNDAADNADRSQRKKRSLPDSDDDDLKRGWGTYIPWKKNMLSAYRMQEAQPTYLEKRFVAPEFIGRRDSLSTILSALDALQFARNQPRSTSKRVEAPLFIGKRGSNRPLFIGKRNQIYTREMNVPDGYVDIDSIPRLSDVNFDAYERIPNDYKLSPFRDIYLYSGEFPGSIDLKK